jgi:integrase
MAYPRGTKFSPWTLNYQTQRGNVKRFAIWRYVRLPDGARKLERLPVEKYRLIRNDESELKKLCVRLNDQVSREDRSRKVVEIKHAFIDVSLLDDYREYLLAQIPSKFKATTNYFGLTKYFLNFFINQLHMNDPLEWHMVHETKWAKYLDSKEVPQSAGAKKEIVAAANRFMAWLHKRRPAEVPPLVFKPLSAAKYKEIEARRRMNGEMKVRGFINEEHWKLILKNAPDEIAPFIQLAYGYGLRRSECMGLTLDDVRTGHLAIERQLVAFPDGTPKYGPLKGREFRKCPHWFSSPTQTYKLVNDALTRFMHPDTLTDRWNALMLKLKLPYDFHDLRHTWVTRALHGRDSRDVQLAAGHKNITTTMKYAHDDRTFDDKKFVPGGT